MEAQQQRAWAEGIVAKIDAIEAEIGAMIGSLGTDTHENGDRRSCYCAVCQLRAVSDRLDRAIGCLPWKRIF